MKAVVHAATLRCRAMLRLRRASYARRGRVVPVFAYRFLCGFANACSSSVVAGGAVPGACSRTPRRPSRVQTPRTAWNHHARMSPRRNAASSRYVAAERDPAGRQHAGTRQRRRSEMLRELPRTRLRLVARRGVASRASNARRRVRVPPARTNCRAPAQARAPSPPSRPAFARANVNGAAPRCVVFIREQPKRGQRECSNRVLASPCVTRHNRMLIVSGPKMPREGIVEIRVARVEKAKSITQASRKSLVLLLARERANVARTRLCCSAFGDGCERVPAPRVLVQ